MWEDVDFADDDFWIDSKCVLQHHSTRSLVDVWLSPRRGIICAAHDGSIDDSTPRSALFQPMRIDAPSAEQIFIFDESFLYATPQLFVGTAALVDLLRATAETDGVDALRSKENKMRDMKPVLPYASRDRRRADFCDGRATSRGYEKQMRATRRPSCSVCT